MKRVREIAAANKRPYDPLDVKTLAPGLEPWLRGSTLVQSMQTLCAHDKTQLRFWLPAQCFVENQETFEKYLKEGLLVVPLTTDGDDEWAKGALVVECCIVCATQEEVTDAVTSAKVVRFAVRVFPQCAQCQKSFEGVEEGQRKVCNDCRVVFYCNRECQKAHWTEHEPKCYYLRQKESKE